MNRTSCRFPELTYLTDGLTMSTRGRLGRALVDALQGRAYVSRKVLDVVVGDASRELRSGGLDHPGVLAFLGAAVEDTGRACGADRPSLVTGELRWVPVRTRVLETATNTLWAADAQAAELNSSSEVAGRLSRGA